MPGSSTSEPHDPAWTVTILDTRGTWNDVKKIGAILITELMAADVVPGSIGIPGALKDFLSTGSLGSEMQISLTIQSGSMSWASTGARPETRRIDEYFSIRSVERVQGESQHIFENSTNWVKVHINEARQIIYVRVPPTAVLPAHGIEWSEEFPIDLRCPVCLEYRVNVWFPCSTDQSVHGLCTNCYYQVGLCEVDMVLCPYCRQKSSWLDIIPRVEPATTQTTTGSSILDPGSEADGSARARGFLFVAYLRQVVAELRMAALAGL